MSDLSLMDRAVNAQYMVLAQDTGGKETNLKFDDKGFNGFSVAFDGNTLLMFRIIAGCIALIWGIYALFSFSKVENKGGGAMQRIGGWGPAVTALLAVTCLFDMEKTVQLLNLILRGGRAIMNLFTSGFSI